MARYWVFMTILALLSAGSVADDQLYTLDYDFSVKRPDGSEILRRQVEGVTLPTGASTHSGPNLRKYDYSLLLAGVQDGEGTLSIFFYEYDSKDTPTKIVSEVINDASFSLGTPAEYEAQTDTFRFSLTFTVKPVAEEATRPRVAVSIQLNAGRENNYLLDGAIRLVPYFVDGRMRGFRVYPGVDRARFRSLGFESGDIIVEYDGTILDDTSKTLDFTKSMDASTIEAVTVARGENRLLIRLN